nr:efflux RND transporter periplasmic adaptor subunit [uncultured Flavobacterium sp.]
MKKYIGFLAVVMFITSCSQKNENSNEEAQIKANSTSAPHNTISLTDAQLKNINLEVVEILQDNIPTTIRLNARTVTTPQDQISVTNMLGGFVKSIPVLPGNRVKKGEIIAVLEDPTYVQLQEDYLTTKALIEKANSNYNRQKDLNDSQAASTKVLEEAKAELNLLQIKKRALEEKLQLINLKPSTISLANIKRSLAITSPVNGIVNAVLVNRGQYVSSSEAILEIIQTGTPMLKINAFENDLPYLKVGQELEAFSNAKTNEKITAKIVSISQSVNADGSVDVLAQISKQNQIPFTANMYFNVELTTENKASNVLPVESVVHFDGKDYVFEVKSNNEFELIAVKIGNKANDKIEILSDLDISKKYVSKGAYALLMAMKNSPEEEE